MGITFFIYVWHFNPRSPCGERLIRGYAVRRERGISIHAPRAGSDERPAKKPLSPCLFQSTLPVRGAAMESGRAVLNKCISIHAPRAGSGKYAGSDLDERMTDFNPRSPCGERPVDAVEQLRKLGISIHAPRAGSGIDLTVQQAEWAKISIHAPRAGSGGTDCSGASRR